MSLTTMGETILCRQWHQQPNTLHHQSYLRLRLMMTMTATMILAITLMMTLTVTLTMTLEVEDMKIAPLTMILVISAAKLLMRIV